VLFLIFPEYSATAEFALLTGLVKKLVFPMNLSLPVVCLLYLIELTIYLSINMYGICLYLSDVIDRLTTAFCALSSRQ
jgi:hypothetical protein